MKMKKRVLPALLLTLFAGAMAPAASAQQQFTSVVVFGDSLSDAGYYRPFLAGLGLPASVVATLGRFTTNPGPVFSELLTTHYTSSAPGPSNVTGGLIFAQGGARVALASPLTPPGQAQRPVSTQVGEFLGANGGAADPNALYSVFAGANDIFVNLATFQAGAITQAQLQTNVLAAATAEVQQVARLQAAGARSVTGAVVPRTAGSLACRAPAPAPP